MKALSTTVRIPSTISLVLLLPFIALELINRRNFNGEFPFPIFVVMWLLPFTFMLAMMPIFRSGRQGVNKRLHVVGLFLRVAFLILIGWMWVHLIADQMPCFLGVANCD